MKTQITAILIVCGALLASATTASAFTRHSYNQACLLGICWTDDSQWTPNYGGRADADTGTVIGETEVAEIDTSGFVGFSTAAVSETELPSNALASTEFGNCLLNDEPIDLESLVDCRSDACLGRKFYYGL